MTTPQPGAPSRFFRRGTLGWAAVLLSLLLVLVACGGDSDEPEPNADPTSTPAATESSADNESDADADVDADEAADADAADADAAEDAEADAAEDADADEATIPDAIADLASESGSATVTIGDETFEFSLAGTQTIDGTTYIGRCQSLFGMIIGSGYSTDGRDITVDLEVPPVDWETYEDGRFDPPGVEVEDNAGNASWVADAGDAFVLGSSVGEYEQEGVTASGTAIFINQWAPDSEPVEGSFEIDCEA